MNNDTWLRQLTMMRCDLCGGTHGAKSATILGGANVEYHMIDCPYHAIVVCGYATHNQTAKYYSFRFLEENCELTVVEFYNKIIDWSIYCDRVFFKKDHIFYKGSIDSVLKELEIRIKLKNFL